jgi:hypothetical protein
MAEGFRVKIGALNEAADGVAGTVEVFSRQPVSAIPYDSTAVGADHPEVGDSISGFLGGWQRGVQNLVSDSVTLASALIKSATAYDKADNDATDAASGLFQGTGPDPGLQ